MFRRRRKTRSTEKFAASAIDQELASLAQTIAGDVSELGGSQRALRDAIDADMAALESAERDYAAKLAGADPDEAGEIVRQETGNHTLANRVSLRLWEANLATLPDDAFVELAEETESSLKPTRVDYVARMVALDAERERRGMPLGTPLIDLTAAKFEQKAGWTAEQARFAAATQLRWEANARAASSRVSEADAAFLGRAEAEEARAARALDRASLR